MHIFILPGSFVVSFSYVVCESTTPAKTFWMLDDHSLEGIELGRNALLVRTGSILEIPVGNDLLAKNRPGDKDILAGKRENATTPEPQDSYACVVMRGRVKK